MKKEGDIYIHIWFGPCPNSTVRATAPCAPDSTPRGPAPDSTPRGRRPPLKRQRARRTTRLTARSRARLPALTVPCAPSCVGRPRRPLLKRKRARRTARRAVPCPASGPHGAVRAARCSAPGPQVFGARSPKRQRALVCIVCICSATMANVARSRRLPRWRAAQARAPPRPVRRCAPAGSAHAGITAARPGRREPC